CFCGGIKMHIKVAAVYIAAVIGAGFASGQEIALFFARYGRAGIWGALLAGFLFSIMGVRIIRLCIYYRVNSYQEALSIVGGRAHLFLDILYTLFLFISLAVMLAGAGEVLAYLSLPIEGEYLTALFVLLALLGGATKVMQVSSWMV